MTCSVKMMDFQREIHWINLCEENRKRGSRCLHDEWVWVEDEKYPQRDGKRLKNNSCWSLMNRYQQLAKGVYGAFLTGSTVCPSLVESIEGEMLSIARQMKERKEDCSVVQYARDYMDFLEVNQEKIQQRKQENLAAYPLIIGKQDCDQ